MGALLLPRLVVTAFLLTEVYLPPILHSSLFCCVPVLVVNLFPVTIRLH
jgi:hypothetical protein